MPDSWDPNRQNNPYGDMGNTGYATPASQASAAARGAFLNKVYLTLFAGIAVALGTSFYIMDQAAQGNAAILKWAATNFWVPLLIYIGLAFAAGAVTRIKGVNLIVFGIFTAFTGVIISPLLYYAALTSGSTTIIWNALGLTGVVFGGLTGFVLVTGKDFSFLKGFVWMGLLVLIGFMIATFFFQAPAFQMGVTAAGIFVFALFVLYDTSNVLHHYGVDEWAGGALALFIDFINIFIRILALLSDRR